MAAGGWDGFEDPEEIASDLAASVYLRVFAGKAAAVLASMVLAIVVTFTDWTYGVLSLFALPLAPRVLLALFMGFEIRRVLAGVLENREERSARRERRAGMTEEQKSTESAQNLRAMTVPPPWWRHSPRTRRFWGGLSVRAVYSACFGFIMARHFGDATGAAAAVAYTAAIIFTGQYVSWSVAGWRDASLFADYSAPRDSPEM